MFLTTVVFFFPKETEEFWFSGRFLFGWMFFVDPIYVPPLYIQLK